MTRIEARPGEVVTADVAPAAPAAPAAEVAGEKKKGPAPKVTHPALEGGAKLEAVPEDYDPSPTGANHAMLKESDFADHKLDVYYRWKASGYEAKAAEWIAKAESFARLGGIGNRKVAMKLESHTASIRKDLEALIASGVDVSGLPDAMFTLAGLVKPGSEA
jgi:hypothetical protein